MSRSTWVVVLCCSCALPCQAQEAKSPSTLPAPKTTPEKPVDIRPQIPPPEATYRVAPINLASALQLVHSRPIDVELAAERIRAAAASLQLARAAWLPTVTMGGDYYHHDGLIQDTGGAIQDISRSGLMLGVGSGVGTAAVFSPNDAIMGPLAARQILRAREADLQTANNNTMVAVTDAYFGVEQARGELAGAADVTRRMKELVRRVSSLATGLVPPLEVTRAEGELARREEAETTARERWETTSAELARVLRLDPSGQFEPLEPPHLQIVLIDIKQTVDDLVAMGLLNRPELAANRAQVQATLTLLKQEKLRPLIPSVLVRGWSTPAAGTLGAGLFSAGRNTMERSGFRDDFDVQVLWQLDNLGFGNRARIRQRDSDMRQATLELFRMQDRVAAEVAQAYAQATQSTRRAVIAERELKLSVESYDKNLIGLGQTHRVGDLVLTIVRPQEAVAAAQFLAQAYTNYYTAIADTNRAQFRLYRALGQPAQNAGAVGQLPACASPPEALPVAVPANPAKAP